MAISTIDSSGLTSPLTSGVTTNTVTSAASTALTLQSAGTTAVTIDTSQNVGIGTTSPTTVGGVALCVYDSSAPRIRLTNSTTGNTSTVGGELTIAGSDFIMENRTTSANLRWYNNGSERMRIDSSGNLLVGTTSTGSTANGFQINNGSYGNSVIVSHNNTSASGIGYIGFYYSSGQIGSITQNGTTAVSYNTSSDYRLKENIAPLTGALNKVAQLKPVTYTWKSAPDETGEGFIAHELAEVCPHAVHGSKDAVDADGNPVYQGIDTSFLVATLTAAIQELKAINDTQAETINALTARIEALENK